MTMTTASQALRTLAEKFDEYPLGRKISTSDAAAITRASAEVYERLESDGPTDADLLASVIEVLDGYDRMQSLIGPWVDEVRKAMVAHLRAVLSREAA